ncbi:DNA recombination protein RmuC [Actinoallomurus spadix]|uniref:DNA recombination protein RmuC n=1 Tax=Actinoallomurus spadix TaxID=79912 RepID=A0ABN0XBV1_9ACTN|nr:DNA recombination protein RmuC [Actinoallomurus spadix]MCO5987730.1 DNA recombination protein RmuC [Actinoallomurus spadix]
MNTLTLMAVALLSGLTFGGLGYLIARTRLGAEHRRFEADLKVAEERYRQAGQQIEQLRAEHEEVKTRADRLEQLQTAQATERRALDERLGRLDTELAAVRERERGAHAEAERLRIGVTNKQNENEALVRDLRAREQEIAELRALDGRYRQEVAEYKKQLAGLEAQQQALREQAVALDAARKELDQSREDNNRLQAESFRALATEILEKSQDKLVTAADGKLSATSTAVRERLEQLDQYLRQFDQQRTSADTDLKHQITRLAEDYAEGRQQTRALVEALRKPQVRGAWGEMHLQRAAELAGMHEHCDFTTQVQVDGDEGRLRPDMVVHLAGGKHVVVDAKVSLAAFLAATEATDNAERERYWAEHAKQLRKHVDTLAGKEYFRKVAGSPEFVVMYLPGEALLQPAVEKDPQLLEYAVSKRVFIAGPTTLITMLRTIAFAWTQAALQDNMRQVYELGRELYERIGKLGEHLASLGASIDRSVTAYNRAVGSLESRVLVTARKFRALEIVEGALESPKPTEQAVRRLGAAELVASAEAAQTVRALPESTTDETTEIA